MSTASTLSVRQGGRFGRSVAFVCRMAWRETRASWTRLLFFFLCVAIGVAAIIVLRSVVQQVRETLTREARSLIGADLAVQTNRPWTPEIKTAITSEFGDSVLETNEVVETQTMAASADAKGTGTVRLVELRGVEAAVSVLRSARARRRRPIHTTS